MNNPGIPRQRTGARVMRVCAAMQYAKPPRADISVITLLYLHKLHTLARNALARGHYLNTEKMCIHFQSPVDLLYEFIIGPLPLAFNVSVLFFLFCIVYFCVHSFLLTQDQDEPLG